MLNRTAKGNEVQHTQLREEHGEEEQHSSRSQASVRKKGVVDQNFQHLERSSLNLKAEVNEEETHRQLEIPSDDLNVREQERKKEQSQRNRLKNFVIAGLVVVIIILLLYPLHQRIGMLEAQSLKSKEAKGTNEAEGDKVIGKTQEKTETTNGNLSNVDQPEKLSSWVSDPKSGVFEVPHFVWTYVQNIQRNTFFIRKCLENIERFSKQSNFQMTILNDSNYMNFVGKDTTYMINDIIQILKDRMVKQPNSTLKDNFETIKRRLIVYHVLNENGGIFIEKNVFFTQTFQWLNDIERNIYVNKGSSNVKAKYFGFSDLDHGTHIQRYNKTGVAYEAEKYMVKLPTFEPYFLVAQPRQEFLAETLVEYVEILINPKSFRQKYDRHGLYMEVLNGKDIYFEVFYTSQLIVLARKQQDINRMGLNKFGDTFSIDYYGLLTMNDRYFPKKTGFYLEKSMHDKFYWNLARYSITELEAILGPMRYLTYISNQDNLELQLFKAREGIEKNFIHPKSLLGQHVINNNSQPYILKEYVREVAHQKKTWDKLPRKIWQYWDTGLKNSTVGNKLCFDNLRRSAAQHNFTVIQLNDSNTEQYVGKELNDKINNWLKNAKVQTYKQSRSDFIRLAVIAKHGGIYLDLSQFTVKGIEWVLNIAQAPIESISNRYGELPKVLGSHWPHYGVNFNQSYDKRVNTNRQMVNDYENHFIVAEPNQQLIWDWLEEYGKFVTTPYVETERVIREVGMFGDHWTIYNNMYLAAMECLKIVVAKKNKIIQKLIDKDPNYKGPLSGAQYYGLWSINSYREFQRFRAHSNFDYTYNLRTNDYNVYMWRYSHEYIEGLIGKVQTFSKLYVWNMRQLNNFLTRDFINNFSDLHPHSLVAKYVYLPKFHKLTKQNGTLQLELLNP